MSISEAKSYIQNRLSVGFKLKPLGKSVKTIMTSVKTKTNLNFA